MGHGWAPPEYLSKPIDRGQLNSQLNKYHVAGTDNEVLIIEDDDATRDVIRRSLAKQAGP
jgi:hypothetical protein